MLRDLGPRLPLPLNTIDYMLIATFICFILYLYLFFGEKKELVWARLIVAPPVLSVLSFGDIDELGTADATTCPPVYLFAVGAHAWAVALFVFAGPL